MKNICVVHLTYCSPKTSIASARVAQYLANHLNADLVDGIQRGRPFLHHTYDTILYVNSMGAFAEAELRLELADQIRRCKNLIYVQNDYTVQPISQVQKVLRDERGWSFKQPFDTTPPYIWSNIPENATGPGNAYVNWNLLTWDPIPLEQIDFKNKVQGLMYYGSYRKDREPYFKRYFEDAPYPVHISTNGKAIEKFKALAPNMTRHGSWKSMKDLSKFAATVYIEDEHIHTHYNSPANRFYECLSAGVAMFFDESTSNTMKTAFPGKGDYLFPVVSSSEDVLEALPTYEQIAHEQRELFKHDYLTDLDDQTIVAWENFLKVAE